MVTTQTLWLAGASLVLPFLSSVASDSALSPRAEEGQRIRRTVSLEAQMKLVRVRQSQNGDSTDDGGTSGFHRNSSTKRIFTAIDEIEAASKDGATRFLRSFDGMKGHTKLVEEMDGDKEWGDLGSKFEVDSPLVSSLNGQAVRFALGDDQWNKTPAPGSPLEAAQLQGLSTDLALEFLLPNKTVRRGGRWTASVDGMRQLLSLGGELGFEKTKEPEDGVFSSMMSRVPIDPAKTQWTGKIDLVHKGKVQVRGSRRIAIQIKVDATATNHATFEMPSMAGQEAPPGASMGGGEIATDYEVHYKGTGQLEWDAEIGQVVSLDLKLDVNEVASEANSMNMPGMGKLDIETSEVSEGTVKIGFEAALLKDQ